MEPEQSRKGTELVEVSVVLRQEDTTLWSTARQGMEQAAADLGAELRLLTLESAGSAEEQADLLQREVAGGAGAVVLVPADTDVLGDVVKDLGTQVPVVTMETDMEPWGACAFVGMDNAALGSALGQAALNGALRGKTVLLIDSVGGHGGVQERLEAAASVLEAAGRTVRVCRAENGESLREAVAAAVERLRRHQYHRLCPGAGVDHRYRRPERVCRRISGGGGRRGGVPQGGPDGSGAHGVFHCPEREHV